MRINFRFSGHQTFAFRYGWLEKGVRGLAADPDLFRRDDAPTQLGVGKNMVASIRHWCEISQLFAPSPNATSGGNRRFEPSTIARFLLLGDDARDPYLEDDGSLWLIHWLMATNPSIGTTIQLLFSSFHRPDFSRRELISYLLEFASKRGLKARETVLTRDVDCVLRAYCPTGAGGRGVIEESFDCPLHELYLIRPAITDDLFRFSIGHKASLPAAIFAFALHQYFERRESRSETMSVQECLYGEASPGQAFRLDENSLIEYLEEIEDRTAGSIVLDETAGLKQILRKSTFRPLSILDEHYQGRWR